jgi:hypothetical protein
MLSHVFKLLLGPLWIQEMRNVLLIGLYVILILSVSDLKKYGNLIFFFHFLGTVFQLCVWSMDGWEKQASKFLQIPSGRVSSTLAQTRVQFHQDQTHVLAVHETQIAIYEAPKLECLKQVCKK